MAKVITLTQSGSNIKFEIVVANILHYRPITYNRTGENVTHITFSNNSTMDVIESIDKIKQLISGD